jgi:AcrR family transcriptional regulator
MAMKAARRRAARDYHHGDLKSALLAEARAVLERAGPESISLRAVGRTLGVSQTAPYNHFTSKDHLLATLAKAGFHELEASQVAAAQSARSATEQIETLGRAYVRFACHHPQLYRLMFGAGVADWRAHPDVAEAKKSSYSPVQKALAAYLATMSDNNPDAVETAAVAAWALAHGLSMLLIDGALDAPRGADEGIEPLVARVTAWLVAGLEAKVKSHST